MVRRRAEISDATYKAVVYKGRKLYEVRYRIYYPDGTVKRPCKRFPTKTDAQFHYSEICDDLARGRRQDIPVLKTIGEIADEYLATSSAHQMESSQKIEAKIVSSIFKHIDRTRAVTSFSRDELAAYIKSRSDKPTMARHECRVLRKIFSIAVEQGILLASPAEKLRSMKRVEPPIYYLSAEEVRQVLDLARMNAARRVTTHDYRGVMYLYCAIAFFTGARPGEIYRMRLEDFDTDLMTLTIRAGKTHRVRVVGITDEVVEALRLYVDSNHVNKTDVLIKSLSTGGVPNLRKTWDALCLQAIGKKVPMYITRHTFARLIVLDGAPANVAQNLLGHASLAMTTRYTRIKNEQTQAVASRLSAALGRKLDENQESLK